MSDATLLIAWHSRTGASEAMARAAAKGAGDVAQALAAHEVMPEDLLEASGYLFVCPENLATMSGMIKEMFDRLRRVRRGGRAGADRPDCAGLAAETRGGSHHR